MQEKLHSDIHQAKIRSRGIGSKFGLFWLHYNNELVLWKYDSVQEPTKPKAQKKIAHNQDIRCVAIGKISQKEGKFLRMEDDEFIVAVGFSKVINLYALDMKTWEWKSLDIKLRVDYSESLEQLMVSDSNEVIFMTDGGTLTRVSLADPFLPNRPKTPKNVLKCSAPSPFTSFFAQKTLATISSKTKIFTEKILTDPLSNKIYVLFRKETEENFLRKWATKGARLIPGLIVSDD